MEILVITFIVLFVYALINSPDALPGLFIGIITLVGIWLFFSHALIVLAIIFLASLAGCLFYISNIPEKNKIKDNVESLKERVINEAISLGVYRKQQKLILVDEFVTAVLSKYELSLKNDYRRIASPDNYGRVKRNQLTKWETHLIKIVDTCRLDENADSLRKYIKQLIIIQNTPNRDLELKQNKELFDDDILQILVEEELNNFETAYLTDTYPAIAAYQRLILKAFSHVFDSTETTDFNASMSGLDYEKHCAYMLRKHLWNVTELPATGDHGADLIAKLNSITVAIQCKKYSKPLGNSSVQEVSAAKTYYKTGHAIVVSNSTYTKGAQLLADANNVKLLHHDDLSDLYSLISNNRTQ